MDLPERLSATSIDQKYSNFARKHLVHPRGNVSQQHDEAIVEFEISRQESEIVVGNISWLLRQDQWQTIDFFQIEIMKILRDVS